MASGEPHRPLLCMPFQNSPEFIGGSGLAAVSGDGETRMSMKSAVLRVVVILGCLTGAAVGTMAQQATAHGTTTVVQMSYYALPGKEQEVLSIRLSACDVLEKHGVTRGRVLTRSDGLRETKHGDNPDVVWEGEFSDAASLERYEEIAGKHPDFIAAVQKMRTVTRIPSQRRYYQLNSGR